MKIEKLKEEARRHEQREEWSKAMQVYARALGGGGDEDDSDIALHNRMGDLQIRLGDLEGALESYEKAIDLYLAADLPNNAMAVCRKLERNAPGRPAVLLRMGQIRVRQGFVVDARQDFLGYAESRLSDGDVDGALRALEEFASLAPDDVETRLFLVDHLRKVDREDDALEYLRQAYRTVLAAGDQEVADAIRSRAAEISETFDLDATPSELTRDREPSATGTPAGFESTALSGFALDEAPEADAGPAEDEEREAASSPEEAPGSQEPDEFDEAFEGAFTFEDLDEAGEAASEAEEPSAAKGEYAAAEDAPAGVEDEPAALSADETAFPPDETALSGDDADLPAFRFDDELLGEEPDDEAFDPEGPPDLPLLDDEPPEIDPDADESEQAPAGHAEPDLDGTPDMLESPLPDLEPRSGDDQEEPGPEPQPEPSDADAWRRMGVDLLESGEEERGREALERAHRAYDEAGDPERAMRVVRELIFHEPDEIAHYQRLVEYAHRTGDRTLLVPAFLELGEALVRSGASRKAEVVYGQVLALDPRNPRARRALALEGAGTGGPAASRRDFVDLGGMVLDEPEEASFRWTVADEDADPSGDEDADFARMLARFKEKVSRNLPSDDATAHYDLGAAYKEMGLLDEAVAQFQGALRAFPGHLAAFEMAGQCFLEKGEPDMAIRTLERALQVDPQVDDELVGIYYYLGKAHEEVGNRDPAREFYERVFSLDINFKDVTERLRALR